jgi:purine-binding chemotaxis protein CheW
VTATGRQTEPSAASDLEILEARAQLLAQPLVEPTVSERTVELLVFACAGGTYAVDAGSVVEVVPLADPTPVPSTPPALAGVINHRGRIVAVVDLARLLPAAQEEPSGAGLAVVVRSGNAILGLCADAVSGVLMIDERDLLPADHLGEQRDDVVRGLTPALAAILDLDAVVSDPRVMVDDEAE